LGPRPARRGRPGPRAATLAPFTLRVARPLLP
jgi:hypothetical protein